MRKTTVPESQQVPKFGEIKKVDKLATGGYVTTTNYINGGIIPGNGQYYIDQNSKITDIITRTNSQVQTLSSLTHKSMFVLACITLGLDTPELRSKFAYWFNQIDSNWPEDFIYEWLIQKAYEVKYGEPDIT